MPGKQREVEYNTELGGCVTRLLWMAGGPVVLAFCALSIIEAPGLSIFDLALWLTIAAMIGARYVDVARFRGMTAHAEPASLQHVARYAGALITLGLAIWGVAHVVEVD